MLMTMNQKSDRKSERIYLDHASATPMDERVFLAMQEFSRDNFGNASAIHEEGRKAKVALNQARTDVARVLKIRSEQVVFTSGGTESNNLALLGIIQKLKNAGREYKDMEILSTKLEHPSIINTLNYLAELGVKIVWLKVDEEGMIDLVDLQSKINDHTVLLTTAYANSEIGVVASVSRISRILKAEEKNGRKIIFHLDAAQAPLWLPCDLSRLGVDLLSLDAGKCRGPKGVGVLAWRGGSNLVATLFGGGQEANLRPGTENVAGAVGFAKALALAQENYEERAEKVGRVRDYFLEALNTSGLKFILNGPRDKKDENRIANNLNISLLNFDTEYCAVYLDTNGVSASTKSACSGAGGGVSTVVLEISEGDTTRASSTLRFSLGEETTKADIDYTISILRKFTDLMAKSA